jgi:hypothetical protein
MKKANRIVILLSTISVVLVSLLFFLSSNVNNQEKLIVIYPPTEANDRFLYHPEAWNKIFNNVSTIVEFWNVEVPSYLAGESITEIIQAYGARIDLDNPEYAYCYVYVKIRNCNGLSQTLAQLGFIVRNVCFGHSNELLQSLFHR